MSEIKNILPVLSGASKKLKLPFAAIADINCPLFG